MMIRATESARSITIAGLPQGEPPTARTLLTCHRSNSVNIFYWTGALVDLLVQFISAGFNDYKNLKLRKPAKRRATCRIC
jgi:hypothetical protein